MIHATKALSRSWWIGLSILAGCVEKGDGGATDTSCESISGSPDSGGSSGSTAEGSTTEPSSTGADTTGSSGVDSTGEADTSTTGSTSTGADDTTGGTGTSAGASSTGESGGSESTGTTGGGTGDETTGDESSGTDTAAAPSFEGEIQPIFSEECGCHKGKGGEDPVLSAGKAYDNIVGVASDDVPEMKLVDPGSSQTSYLWHKINDTHKSVGGKGKRMPPGDALSAEQIELVAQWIDAGALP